MIATADPTVAPELPLAAPTQPTEEAALRAAYDRSRLREIRMSFAEALEHPTVSIALKNAAFGRCPKKGARRA